MLSSFNYLLLWCSRCSDTYVFWTDTRLTLQILILTLTFWFLHLIWLSWLMVTVVVVHWLRVTVPYWRNIVVGLGGFGEPTLTWWYCSLPTVKANWTYPAVADVPDPVSTDPVPTSCCCKGCISGVIQVWFSGVIEAILILILRFVDWFLKFWICLNWLLDFVWAVDQ